jgi:predicted nicotinamide N-methyase
MNKPLEYSYKTLEFDGIDIHVKTLKNKNQFSDDEHTARDLGISSAQWSLFGVVWDCSMVLAHEMIEQDIEGKKILEVGCGIAVASHVLNARGANITATDYHPEVETFLKINAELNEKKLIPFVLENWNTAESNLGKFDLIVASDVLYESEHIELLSQFLVSHAEATCEIIVVDPNRGHINKFTRAVQALGFTHEAKKSTRATEYKAMIHRYQRS